MKTIKLTSKNQDNVIDEGFAVLKNGGVVVTPSETQYGLSADPTNENAVEKVYAIKGRDFNSPLGLVAGSTQMISDNFLVNETEQKLIDIFWPGPFGLQLLIADNKRIHRITKLTRREAYDATHLEMNKKVVRVSSNHFLAELSNDLGWPIISTSANLSGQPACYDVKSVIKQFEYNEHQPDLIIDAGVLSRTPPSTMLDLTGDTPTIIRKGTDFGEVEKVLSTLK